jgi:hypothetical protein
LSLLTARPWAAAAAGPQEVKAAVGRGVEFLKSQQNANGTFRDPYGNRLGGVALAGLALRASEVPADDPSVQQIAEYVRANAPQNYQTYDVSLSILFLDRMTRDKSSTELRSQRQTPASKKLRSGRIVSGSQVRDSQQIVDLGKRLQGGQGPSGTWSYSLQGPSDGDHSNTQFGVLGLWIACQHGLDGADGLKRCARHFRDCQSQDGGWGYVQRNVSSRGLPAGFGGMFDQIGEVIGGETPSMTCAGLIALATDLGAQTQLSTAPRGRKLEEQRGDEQVERAMRLLESFMQGDAPAGRGRGKRWGNASDLYFAWSLERVGVLYGRKKIGETDWYAWGVDRLLDPNSGSGQRGNGSWPGNYGPMVDTSFALLFLNRADVSPELTEALASQFGDGPHGLRSYLPGTVPGMAGQDEDSQESVRPADPREEPSEPWTKQTTVALLSALESSTDPAARRAITAELATRRPTYAQVEDQLPAIRRFLASRDQDTAAAARDQLENAFQRAPMSHCLFWLGKADKPLDELIWQQIDRRTARADRGVRSGYRDVAVKVLGHEQFSDASKTAALELLVRLNDAGATGSLIEVLPRLPVELWPKAGDLLREWTGEDYGPRPGDKAAEVASALEKWRNWRKQEGGTR